MTIRIEFERETCTRCGGSGLYPSACIPVGRCYKCFQGHNKPGGFMLSRAGAKARAKFDAWADVALAVRVADLRPGMLVRTRQGERARRVREIAPDTLNSREGRELFHVVFEPGNYTYGGVSADTTLRRPPTEADLRAVAPTLGKGATLVDETEPAIAC